MLEFIKTRDVKNPERDANENAGIDFYIPTKDSFTHDECIAFGDEVEIIDNTIYIKPHATICIPLGIKSKFPNNIALVAGNKSGIATKKHLIFGANVIDASYQGEWHVHLINTSNYIQHIDFGQKIIQFIPYIISTNDVIVRDVTSEEFYTETTNRGTGAFGSTGV